MTIDWHHFTPWTSLAGGLMIGLAASVFILASGRIMGISGILGGSLTSSWDDLGWRLSFILALLVAPAALALTGMAPAPRIDAGWPTLVVGGLLVGFGTRLGSGCTSGHGICGLARLSPRSLVATLTFMLAGFGTVYLIRHVIN